MLRARAGGFLQPLGFTVDRQRGSHIKLVEAIRAQDPRCPQPLIMGRGNHPCIARQQPTI